MDLTLSKVWKRNLRKENSSISRYKRKLSYKVESHLSKICTHTLKRLAKDPYRGGEAILPILAYENNMLNYFFKTLAYFL